MKVKDNNKVFFEELIEGDCFMWCEKHFIKTKAEKAFEWVNAVCVENGHIYAFKGDEYVTIVNAELNID